MSFQSSSKYCARTYVKSCTVSHICYQLSTRIVRKLYKRRLSIYDKHIEQYAIIYLRHANLVKKLGIEMIVSGTAHLTGEGIILVWLRSDTNNHENFNRIAKVGNGFQRKHKWQWA